MEEKQDEMWLQGDQFRRANPTSKLNVYNKPVPFSVYSLKLKKILLEHLNNIRKTSTTTTTNPNPTSSQSRTSSQASNHSESSFTKFVNKVERIKIEDDTNGNGNSNSFMINRSSDVEADHHSGRDRDHQDPDLDFNNGNLFNDSSSSSNSSTEDSQGMNGNQGHQRPKTMTQGDRLNAIKAKKQTQSCGSMPVEKLKGHVRVKSVPSRVANGGLTTSHHSSGATTSAALSPSRPMTRMQAEAAAGAKSPKRSSALVTSRKSNAVR